MAEIKKLYRRPDEGMIAGVAAGMGHYFNIDISLMRVIFVLVALATGGLAIIAYIVLAIVIPPDPTKTTNTKATNVSKNIESISEDLKAGGPGSSFRNVLGLGLILLGLWLLIGQFFPAWLNIQWAVLWPALLILIGILLVFRSRE